MSRETKHHNKGVLLRMLGNDLHQGLACQWKRLLLVFLLCTGAGLYLKMQARGVAVYYGLTSGATFMDHLLNLLHGMERFVPSENRRFELPVTYLGVFAVTAFLIGGYLRQDLHGFGQQLMVRSRDRKRWLVSKILWNMASVTAVYGIILLTAFLMGGGGLTPTAALCRTALRFPEAGETGISPGTLFALALGMAYLTSLAMAQVQMTLEMIFSPVAALIGVMTLIFLSAYVTAPFLPGNYFMVQRNAVFLADGMQTGQGIVFLVGMILCAVALDFYWLFRQDIL